MRINFDILEKILSGLKCKFAESVYASYLKKQYALKDCEGENNLDELRDYIGIIEEKIKILKYNFKNNNIKPTRINKTSIEYFFEKENSFTKCDKKLLEKLL